jgi:GNAT superfamily N-acetyltransferase
VEISSPEVGLFGGLTVHPDYRGLGLGWSIRLACIAELNPRMTHHEHRAHAPWLIALLAVPPPSPWRQLVDRVRARLSSRDRPCRRRRVDFALE